MKKRKKVEVSFEGEFHGFNFILCPTEVNQAEFILRRDKIQVLVSEMLLKGKRCTNIKAKEQMYEEAA